MPRTGKRTIRIQRCQEDIEHTLRFVENNEDRQIWQCEFCQRIVKFNKKMREYLLLLVTSWQSISNC